MITKGKDGLNRTYATLRVDADKVTLTGIDHTDLSEDKFVITQRAPTPQKVYPGARKSNLAYILGAVSTEAGVPVRRPMRVDISTSHTAGYTSEQVEEAVLRAVNVYLQGTQLVDYVHKGKRPS
jgi:hypothetical protein